MTTTASDVTPESAHLTQWRAVTQAAEPRHDHGCPATTQDGVECACSHRLLQALHSVVLAHKPAPHLRRRTCPDHGREAIYASLSHTSDTCMECTLSVEQRCEFCPASTWPCATVKVIADHLGIEVDTPAITTIG